eukprot:441869-Pelagomonas_calceolata.AAC.2
MMQRTGKASADFLSPHLHHTYVTDAGRPLWPTKITCQAMCIASQWWSVVITGGNAGQSVVVISVVVTNGQWWQCRPVSDGDQWWSLVVTGGNAGQSVVPHQLLPCSTGQYRPASGWPVLASASHATTARPTG